MLNTANHNGWQRGERLDGRSAVQQRVAGADKADKADDEVFVRGTTAEADGEDSDGWWWWQSTGARAAKCGGTVVVPCRCQELVAMCNRVLHDWSQ
jgi:hypothetical protein